MLQRLNEVTRVAELAIAESVRLSSALATHDGSVSGCSKSELADFIALSKTDRPAAWARVEFLQFVCVSIRDADLAEISRVQFVMSR